MDFKKIGTVTCIKDNSCTIEIPKNQIQKQIAKLRLSGFYRISTITGTDTGKLIEIIYHISNETFTINLKTTIPKTNASIETINHYFPGTALYERELSEMIGVRIIGNLSPKNIFLDETSPKTPLRKKNKFKNSN